MKKEIYEKLYFTWRETWQLAKLQTRFSIFYGWRLACGWRRICSAQLARRA